MKKKSVDYPQKIEREAENYQKAGKIFNLDMEQLEEVTEGEAVTIRKRNPGFSFFNCFAEMVTKA